GRSRPESVPVAVRFSWFSSRAVERAASIRRTPRLTPHAVIVPSASFLQWGLGRKQKPAAAPVAHPPRQEQRFDEDSARDLGLAQPAIRKDNRSLHDTKAGFAGPVGHLHLKGISVGDDVVDLDALQGAARVAAEARGRITDVHSRDDAD